MNGEYRKFDPTKLPASAMANAENDAEANFARGMLDRAQQYGDSAVISERQFVQLVTIADPQAKEVYGPAGVIL